MSLVNMDAMLAEATKGKYAVGNFDICDSVLLRGVMNAAKKNEAPVILAYAEVFDGWAPMKTFSAMLLEEAKQSPVPVCVHLDHARSLVIIEKALDCGFTSAMYDGSDLPFDENVRMTAEAVRMCHARGASCEAELGHVGGLDGYSYAGDPYTNVEQAREFVRETGVDALAVSIGTVHGVYKEAPKLNFERLAQLRAALSVPLVLHGGSGLSDEDFKRVIAEGVSKVNIFTELTLAAKREWSAGENYADAETEAISAVCDVAENKMRLFGADGKASA